MGFGYERYDYLFSTWIFIWWILYSNKLVKYNPRSSLSFALFFDILVVVWGAVSGVRTSMSYILFTLLYILVTKLIPLYNIDFNEPETIEDIGFSTGLFCIYLLWLGVNGNSFIGIYSNMLNPHLKF